MQYQIMQQIDGKKFEPAHCLDDQPIVCSCPKEAAKMAKKLTSERGVKHQPRPVIELAGGWKDREQRRFVEGVYKPVVWAAQAWWVKSHNPDHFAHISLKDPTRIAFTRSAKEGSADVQTSMKPGKYLAEFFGDVLTTEQVKEFALQHSTTFENKELKFATTPEEIERVYKPMLGCSCFSGTTKANLYGSGDMAVAYIEGKDGKIKARAVCAPGRKIYVHPYGDYTRLEKLLADAGYKDTGYDAKPWRGLKLLKKWYWNGFYTDFGVYPKPQPGDEEFFVI